MHAANTGEKKDDNSMSKPENRIAGNIEMSNQAKQHGDYLTAGAMRAINVELEGLKVHMAVDNQANTNNR